MFKDKPLASPGLISYRHKSPYGYVMIGATDDNNALSEANRSLENKTASFDSLERWNGTCYVPVLKG